MKIFGVDSSLMWHKDHFLRKPSRELTKEEVLTPEFKEFIREMFASLYENPIGVGLAAPQLGIQVRVAVIDVKRNGKKPIVLINPSYEPIDEDCSESNETCLSFPGRAGCVKRYKKVRVKAKDIHFEDIEFEPDSFLGIVCQHEIDHLNGVVYVDKASDVSEGIKYYDVMANNAIEKLISV